MSGDRYLIRDQNAKQFLTFTAIDWDYKKIYCQTDLAWLELQNCNKITGVNSSSLKTRTRLGSLGYGVFRLVAGDATDAWINENFGFRP